MRVDGRGLCKQNRRSAKAGVREWRSVGRFRGRLIAIKEFFWQHDDVRTRKGVRMRAFVGLELPEGFADDVARMARALGARLEGRFMRRETYHVTLAFLGEIDEAASGRAIDALDAACVGLGPVPLRCEGLGKFGRARDATLNVRLAEEPELMALAARLRDELGARGVAFDGKAFRPHVTIARRASLPAGELPQLVFPADDEARFVTLFKSILDSSGATYKPLYTIDLGE